MHQLSQSLHGLQNGEIGRRFIPLAMESAMRSANCWYKNPTFLLLAMPPSICTGHKFIYLNLFLLPFLG
jgi:hypothetical protein